MPTEAEWEAAIGGGEGYAWGLDFDPTRLNGAESWAGRRFSNEEEWRSWMSSNDESWREAGTTAVTTYLQGASQTGLWDGSGNVWEWMHNPYNPDGGTMALRGGAWNDNAQNARASYRVVDRPGSFDDDVGLRVAVAPVLLPSAS
jgi:formylglycine-generating enzyme required for sulfatase activity